MNLQEIEKIKSAMNREAMSTTARILEASRWYRARRLPPPSLILSNSAYDELCKENDYICGVDQFGTPRFLGMRWLIDPDRLAGWELREDIGNRL